MPIQFLVKSIGIKNHSPVRIQIDFVINLWTLPTGRQVHSKKNTYLIKSRYLI